MRYKVIQNFAIKKEFENKSLTHVKALSIPKTYNFKKNDIVIVDWQGGSLGTLTKYNNVTQGFTVGVWDTEYATLNNPYANPYDKYLKFIARD